MDWSKRGTALYLIDHPITIRTAEKKLTSLCFLLAATEELFIVTIVTVVNIYYPLEKLLEKELNYYYHVCFVHAIYEV